MAWRRLGKSSEPTIKQWRKAEKKAQHIPLARTLDEARVYVASQTCECGGSYVTTYSYPEEAGLATMWRVASRQAEEHVWSLAWIDTECGKCNARRKFDFRTHTAERARPADAVVWFGADEPSQLLDAGQWFMMYLKHSDHAQGKRLRAPQPRDWPIALAALDEVKKFLPPGKSNPPASAFWTTLGKQVQEQFGHLLNAESIDRIRVNDARKSGESQ